MNTFFSLGKQKKNQNTDWVIMYNNKLLMKLNYNPLMCSLFDIKKK